MVGDPGTCSPVKNEKGAIWCILRVPIYAIINIKINNFEDYEGCSNMNANSFITFFTYMPLQNVIPFRKELLVTFKLAPNIKKHSLYFSSYRPLNKGHSCMMKFF